MIRSSKPLGESRVALVSAQKRLHDLQIKCNLFEMLLDLLEPKCPIVNDMGLAEKLPECDLSSDVSGQKKTTEH